MILIVLAAGKGSRLPRKFRSRPKCMVKINHKTILEHNESFFKKFKKKYIILGYKHKMCDKLLKKLKFKKIINKKFKSTNMVFSLFKSKKFINQDVVISYGDVIFSHKIFNKLKSKGNILPVNKNWLKVWKKRMSFNKIFKDAETLKIKKNKIFEIGKTIQKKNFPKYQFMGLVKLEKKSFFALFNFFKDQDKKIDFTSFLDASIKNKVIELKPSIYSSFWYEIDGKKDIEYASRSINYNNHI